MRACPRCGDEHNGTTATCSSCNVARVAAWRAANPEKRKAADATYRARHRAELRIKNRDYARQRQIENPEAVRANRRAWTRTPQGQLYNRLAAHRRRGVTYDTEAREYAEIILRDPCVYCNGPATEIDHISPVVLGGSGAWDNLAPACRPCNARKNDSTLLAFMASTA